MQIELVVYSLGLWQVGMMIIDSLPSEEYGTQHSLTPPLPPQHLPALQPLHLHRDPKVDIRLPQQCGTHPRSPIISLHRDHWGNLKGLTTRDQ